jgi:hypothetical protein
VWGGRSHLAEEAASGPELAGLVEESRNLGRSTAVTGREAESDL